MFCNHQREYTYVKDLWTECHRDAIDKIMDYFNCKSTTGTLLIINLFKECEWYGSVFNDFVSKLNLTELEILSLKASGDEFAEAALQELDEKIGEEQFYNAGGY